MCMSKYIEEFINNEYKDNDVRKHCFAIRFDENNKKENKIILKSNIVEMIISSDNDQYVYLLIDLNKRTHKHTIAIVDGNSMFAQNVIILPEINIVDDIYIDRNVKPLLGRVHIKESNRDFYLTPKHEKFNYLLKEILLNKYKNTNLVRDINDFRLVPINIKYMVKNHYTKKLDCTGGNFVIHGSTKR